MPSMNDSSDPVGHEQHAHVGGRLLGEPPRQLEQRHDAGRRCRLRPGTTFVEPICPITAAAPGRDDAAGDPGDAGSRRASRARPAPGPPKTGNISGGLVSLRSISAGKRRHTKAGIAGWKIRPDLAAS